jgi:N-acetylmuramoyl-L-alanine amidase
MKRISFVILVVCFSFLAVSYTMTDNWLVVKVKPGDGIHVLLDRYGVSDDCSKKKFLELNSLKGTDELHLDRKYKLPVYKHTYNGKSIRSTIGINDYNQAVKIQKYNDLMLRKGLKTGNYRKDKELWVPVNLTDCVVVDSDEVEDTPKTMEVPIFGKEYKTVSIKDNSLKGCYYYLVSGHGGPDPGAMTSYAGHSLCEDEYAYDVTLRLARQLLARGATVYIITRDKNDGIRDGEYFKCDKDEYCWPNQTIPLNQVKRLKQRAGAINQLYKKHKKTAKKQRCIVIHVDSRSKNEQIDVFFYHHRYSKTGKKLADNMQNTFEAKYKQFQKGRGYSGQVTSRNLYMLTKTLPVTCYIELGNIRHERDRKRIILKNNRQALGKWLFEGLQSEG